MKVEFAIKLACGQCGQPMESSYLAIQPINHISVWPCKTCSPLRAAPEWGTGTYTPSPIDERENSIGDVCPDCGGRGCRHCIGSGNAEDNYRD